MFHEVAYPWVSWPLHHNIMTAVNEWMVRQMVQRARICYVSTTAWERRLVRLGLNPSNLRPLPIPSNVPVCEDPVRVAQIREANLRNGASMMVGHFGTYGKWIAEMLFPMLKHLLHSISDANVLLIGKKSDVFRERLVAENSAWCDRTLATGSLSASEIAAHIRACDVMLQPYADGANTRRTTLMACLANGRPTVSTMVIAASLSGGKHPW